MRTRHVRNENEQRSSTAPTARPRTGWERIVAERGNGERWRDIAERAGLSERQCRRIYKSHMRSAPTMQPSRLEREIEDALAAYDDAIEELALISATACQSSPRPPAWKS